MKDGCFEVSLWARADGAGPVVQVLYDRDEQASMEAVPSSRSCARSARTRTTDGWAEYATGHSTARSGERLRVPRRRPPDDKRGNAKALFLNRRARDPRGRRQARSPVACTQANVDSACGAEGDCMFGHCVSSTVTWGANPPAAHRAEIAERWVQFGTRFIGDRNAAQNGATILAPQAREAARTAPLIAAVLRRPEPPREPSPRPSHVVRLACERYTSFAPQVQQGRLEHHGRLFRRRRRSTMGGGSPLRCVRLRPRTPEAGDAASQSGDVLVEIDGMDPKASGRRCMAALRDDVAERSEAPTLGASPAPLSSLITKRASTVTLGRCASASSCGAEARQKITIDIALA